MSARKYHDVWACVDCLFYLANGDLSGIDSETRADAVQLACDTYPFDLTHNADSETGKGMRDFSLVPCDVCGCSLGGQRERFAAWDRVSR